MRAAAAGSVASTGSRTGERAGRGKPVLPPSAVPVGRIVAPAEATEPDNRESLEPIVLDLRGATLQAQAGATLAALEPLEIGHTLLHLNTTVPWFLFPMLETRGIRYQIQERQEGNVRILMWRQGSPSGASPARMRIERIRAL
jgi:hypothetical protein